MEYLLKVFVHGKPKRGVWCTFNDKRLTSYNNKIIVTIYSKVRFRNMFICVFAYDFSGLGMAVGTTCVVGVWTK